MTTVCRLTTHARDARGLVRRPEDVKPCKQEQLSTTPHALAQLAVCHVLTPTTLCPQLQPYPDLPNVTRTGRPARLWAQGPTRRPTPHSHTPNSRPRGTATTHHTSRPTQVTAPQPQHRGTTSSPTPGTTTRGIAQQTPTAPQQPTPTNTPPLRSTLHRTPRLQVTPLPRAPPTNSSSTHTTTRRSRTSTRCRPQTWLGPLHRTGLRLRPRRRYQRIRRPHGGTQRRRQGPLPRLRNHAHLTTRTRTRRHRHRHRQGR